MLQHLSFDSALEFVLREEGGLSDHPSDAGGRTNLGITQRRYDAYRESRHRPQRDVAEIERREAEDIYREEWHAARCDEWPAVVAFVVFDTAVQRGARRAIMDLQEAAGAAADGMVGPKTRAAVARLDPHRLAERLLILRSDHYVERCREQLDQLVFLRGWMRRVVRLAFHAGRQAETAP